LAINGVRIRKNDWFVTWARASRQWLFDTQNNPNAPAGTLPRLGQGIITTDERAPRYAFSKLTAAMSSSSASGGSAERDTVVGGTTSRRRGELITFHTPADEPFSAPDGSVDGSTAPWITTTFYNVWGQQKRGKPTFLPTRIYESANGRLYDYPAWGEEDPGLNFGEKGVSDKAFVDGTNSKNFIAPYRLFQKDADFDQVAEVLDVPMWGPLVTARSPCETYATLAEILAQPARDPSSARPSDAFEFLKFPAPALSSGPPSYGPRPNLHNHLQIEPAQYSTNPGPGGRPNLVSGIQTMPPAVGAITATTPTQQNGIGFNGRLPGGASLLDAFVIDDRGAKPFDSWTSTADPNGTIDFDERAQAENRRLRLARGFEGKLTPGLININTAPIEVMRAMPQMLRLSYDDDFPITKTSDSDPSTLNLSSSGVPTSVLGQRRQMRDVFTWQASPYELGSDDPTVPNSIAFDWNVRAPRVRVPEAIELWRNKGNVNPTLTDNQFPNMPSYFSRGRG
jgi:hypothetical protein